MWPFGNIFIKANQLVIARDEQALLASRALKIGASSRD
jgi:hypothetical protein